jgi:hypothetical protein
MPFVAVSVEHMRDGKEDCARCFHTKEEALEWIEKIANGFAGSNHTFQLFELGREIPLEFTDVSEPQPPKIVKRAVRESAPAVVKERKRTR